MHSQGWDGREQSSWDARARRHVLRSVFGMGGQQRNKGLLTVAQQWLLLMVQGTA